MKKEKQEPVTEIGVGTIVRWAFAILGGLLSVLSAIVTIKAGQVFIGLLFFIPGIFVFIPKQHLRISRPLKTIIFIVAYFVLLIMSGMNTPQPEQQYEYYGLGQSFNITFGNDVFSMKIDNITKETTMKINNNQNLTSSGFYIFVNGGITNLGKTTLDLKFTSELKDGQNNTYSLFAKDTKVGGFQPGLEKEFYHVFETPKQVSGLKFFIKDKTSIIKVVNLE